MSQSIKISTCCENGINPKAVYEFIERADRENLGINSFMLIKNQCVVAEGCYPPYDNDTTHILYSIQNQLLQRRSALPLMRARSALMIP
ncbi:MAG: hypothetical protein IJ927_03860 [Eubacterium sp.]|nr:hypothetical protein [Eubacterium sp.]